MKNNIPTEAELGIDYPSKGKNFSRLVGISVPALLQVASRAVGYHPHSESPLPSIRLFSHGSFNKLFLITFPGDKPELIARVPFLDVLPFSESQIKSQVATMAFVREHRNIPVAKIYDWRSDSNNEVGAPYILQERIHGQHIEANDWFHNLSWKDKMSVVKELARIHVELLRPLPFTSIGNIIFREHVEPDRLSESPTPDNVDAASPFAIGPLARSQKYRDDQQRGSLRVSSSIKTVWLDWMQLEFNLAHERWGRQVTDVIIGEDDFSLAMGHTLKRTSDFADVFRDLHAIIGALDIPAEFQRLCLWHNDLALRNILVHPDDKTKIVAVLDWEDVSVVPCALAARYPEELTDTGDWSVWPDDWTALRVPQDEFDIAGEEQVDTTWLRWYYGACVAGHDPVAASRFWRENELAVKVNYTVFSGWTGWMRMQDWIGRMARDVEKKVTATLSPDSKPAIGTDSVECTV